MASTATVKDYLSIQGSTVLLEWAFSSGGIIASVATVTYPMFLKINHNLINHDAKNGKYLHRCHL